MDNILEEPKKLIENVKKNSMLHGESRAYSDLEIAKNNEEVTKKVVRIASQPEFVDFMTALILTGHIELYDNSTKFSGIKVIDNHALKAIISKYRLTGILFLLKHFSPIEIWKLYKFKETNTKFIREPQVKVKYKLKRLVSTAEKFANLLNTTNADEVATPTEGEYKGKIKITRPSIRPDNFIKI